MKYLILGANGQLGSSLMKYIPNGIGLTRKDVLIEDIDETKKILEIHKPDVVINTTAFHNVIECEKNHGTSFLINYQAVKQLAEICKERNIIFVSISSDHVFGLNASRNMPYAENDLPGPVNTHGVSKLAGEYGALQAWEKSIIIRTSGLYGPQGAVSKGGNFVDKRIKDAQSGIKSLEMSGEQILAPTYTEDLAKAIKRVIERDKQDYGIFHITNEGECSWADLTAEIYRIMKLNIEVIAVDRKGIDRGVRKPIYSVLGNKRLKELGINMPHWKDALRRYLEEKYLSF